MSPGSFVFNFNRDGTILSLITRTPTGRAVIQQNLAIMEAVAGTLTCVKNDDKVATSNDLICVCDSLDCSVDESGKFVVSLNCKEGEAGKFSCESGDHSSGVDSSPDKKKRDGIPKTTNQNATSQASFKTRRGFSFIGALCEFFTGGSDKCDKFIKKRDLSFTTGSSQYIDQ